jgi:hypothetical protein
MDLNTETWMEKRNLRLDEDEVFTYLAVLIALGRGSSIPEGLWIALVDHPKFWIPVRGIH